MDFLLDQLLSIPVHFSTHNAMCCFDEVNGRSSYTKKKLKENNEKKPQWRDVSLNSHIGQSMVSAAEEGNVHTTLNFHKPK